MLARPGHERPNILVILSDDHHFRALGAAGNEAIHTPALDRLAGEGAFFPCCYVSNPTSSPSRACLWTGQYGFRNGAAFAGQAMRADAPRLPRLLSDFGYTTGHTGKWHNEGRPADHGFRYMRHVFLGSMHPYDRIPVVEGARDRPHEIPGNPTDTFTTGAIDLLDHALQEPFALFVCYTAPHDPRTPPAEFEGMYSPERLSLPRNFSPEPPFDPGTLALRDETLLERPLRKEEVLRETARYFGMISHLDAQIGRLLAHLRGTGQLDRTVVFYTSDSGLALGAHGLLGKQTMHEEGVRAPLIVRGAGRRAGNARRGHGRRDGPHADDLRPCPHPHPRAGSGPNAHAGACRTANGAPAVGVRPFLGPAPDGPHGRTQGDRPSEDETSGTIQPSRRSL